VDLITTDGFLFANRVLKGRGLMTRKGFPESYDVRRLVEFVADVKSGVPEARAPVYSHLHYDILPGEYQVVRQPDIMIVEGLNVLQTPPPRTPDGPCVFVSDFFDFSVYVDARPSHIQRWYVERFLTLRETAFQDPQSYFHRYASLSVPEARTTAHLAHHQRRQPPREHPTHPHPRRPHPREGSGPHDRAGPPPEDLTWRGVS
jgi:type I pantothenate kinase